MQMTSDQAEILALQILGWLAADEEAMNQFTMMAGITPADIMAQAGNPEMLGGMLDFFLSDEAMLTRFCEEQEINPETPAHARRILPGGDVPHWT